MALPPPSSSSTALVTGASAGIGTELARGLARRGHGVTLVARREERLRALAAELDHDCGVQAGYVVADLADPAEWQRLNETIAERGLQVEILVNNAGFGTVGPFHKSDLERELEEVRLNCEAVVALTGIYLPKMVERGRGAILNVASSAAFQPQPYNSVYAATKAFALSFSEAIHAELDGTGVTLTAVCPGPVHTEFSEVAGLERDMERVKVVTISAADCAEAALTALEQGKRAVIPGVATRIAVLGSRPLPTSFKLPVMKRIFGRHA